MSPAKGAFVVQAGVIPGVAEEELGLVLPYTSEQFETDRARSEHDKPTFAELRDQALEHAREVIDPARVNWVRFEFGIDSVGPVLETATRSGRPAHLWFRNSELIFGAWSGLDGWWHATAWYLDGRSERGSEGLDLAPAPVVHELAEVAL